MLFYHRAKLSPLLLAIIFITFFHNVLSRHRIRHYKDRFKRQQGANTYLPGSYVVDGGDSPYSPDSGPWSDWSAPSACSRSCGGGVTTTIRQCQDGYACEGPTMRHFSCNTQDCPDSSDFRSQQCSNYDAIPFQGVLYQWVPYTTGENPCELKCKPRGERFYYRHQEAVTDGTRCNDESLDVCVRGKCQRVGCDMMLGSDAREDSCRECGGDGSNCETKQGLLDMQDLQAGYNDILLIPAGATNVMVQEQAPSNNYLAIRNASGHYYLNGNWRIDFPRTLPFAGTKFNYERYPQGFEAPDKVTCLGPTDENLFIMLLYQSKNVGVQFEYSLPTNIQLGNENETYAWTFDQYTPCSTTCGGGVQHRNVTCAGRRTLEPVAENLCDANSKPEKSRVCAKIACEAQWVPHPWGKCSAPCGQAGTQTREVSCQQIVSNGYPTLVSDGECASLPKPPKEQKCNEGKVCANWHIGPWKPCDHLCGDGKQTRKVKCFIKDEKNKIKVLKDEECDNGEPKPEIEKKCNIRPCEGVDWVTSEWSGCDRVCGLKNETRKVQCATSSGQTFADELCEKEQKPITVRECETTNATCQYLWYASQWTECSVGCGEGIQTRTIFCGVASPEGVTEVDKSECDTGKTYETIKNCTGEEKECNGEWYSGPWGECSKQCGGGVRSKKVICLRGNDVVDVSNCDSDKIVFSQEDCNAAPCSDDKILPTDVTQHVDESDAKTTEADAITIVTDGDDISESTTEIGETESETVSPDDEEYEVVPDDECEDGEWIDEEVDVTRPQGDDDLLGVSATTTELSVSDESSFSDDDLMLSDGTTTSSDDVSESGSGETSGVTESSDSTTSTSTDDEGSGDITVGTTEESDSGVDSPLETRTSSGGTTDSSSTDDVERTTVTFEPTSSDASSTTSDDDENESTTGFSTSSVMTDTTESGSSSTTTYTTETTVITDTTLVSETSEADSSETSISTTESSTEFSSTTESGATSDITVDLSSTTDVSVGSTDGLTTDGATTDFTVGSTELDSTGTTVIVNITTDVNVDYSSTTEEATTSASTELTTESSSDSTETTVETSEKSVGTTDSDIWDSTTAITETMESSTASDQWETSTVTDIFETMRPRMCRRPKQKICKKASYGCCWDNITPAKGPFDKGCPLPKTCKESKFGCCEDGVSAALGRKFKGCPPTHCNETLFGCCSDKKTPADGDNDEGCPPPPPKCLKSRYGCCKDNATAAKGPKLKGCDKMQVKVNCSNSTYGCCPDGVKPSQDEYFKGCDGIFKKNCNDSMFKCCPDGRTSATGPSYRGCAVACKNSSYGCCPDGVTPSHGYNGEGCCLSSPFGCCPDNIVPARGANNEGCGCQNEPFGCCPDNSTAARGYRNEGCGCQYTEHGCCVDNYTPAYGKDYAGCLCHTFQFGCCQDGVTVAKGPHKQGCGCRNSEFGCCDDEQTSATGPNREGCGCVASKHGCCPDGVSEARGDKFEGCENIPVNLQDSCTVHKERGSCRNYTVKWFFDMEYGGCSRFWYGGCDGNDNRFKSKEECDGVCVSPPGPDRCKLPKIAGPCEGYYPQWFYDKESRHCAQFIYGGCLGNNNRFETREECMELCVKDDRVDACEQSKEEGPCHGQYRRYYYDKQAGDCREFIFGGCKGNNNNFATVDACKQQCTAPGRKKDHCSLPRAQGNCTSREPRWYYDTPEKRCLPFYYSGCHGNNNNFNSKEACENDCPIDIVKDTCQLPAETGECGNYVDRWYYDTKEKTCRQFYYGGCGGNGNNFETEAMCQQRCTTRSPPPVQEPERPQPSPPAEPFRQEYCFLDSDVGPCRNATIRYYYDRNDGVCKSFTFGGCQGNGNNFNSIEECLQRCGNAQDQCTLPVSVGPCDGEYVQYYYEQATDTCRDFVFGGCGGNNNRFQDQQSCEQQCKKMPAQVQVTQVPEVPKEIAMCYQQADSGNCTENYSMYYYNATSGQCNGFTYTGCGGNGNRFNSEEQCQRQCGSFRGQDVCNMERDSGPCRGYFVKYYYDVASRQCTQFAFGGCNGNGNRFSSQEECESICFTHEEHKPNQTSTVICQLPADKGSCQDSDHRRWYFDYSRGECIAFIYSGCGGNFNNFKTFESCKSYCREFLPPTEAPAPIDANPIEPHKCQSMFDVCTNISCAYGIEPYIDENQCQTCKCHDPCSDVGCPENTQCGIDFNRNKTEQSQYNFIGVCREINKAGTCPNLVPSNDSNCDQPECRNDADCSFTMKCCSVGCTWSCVEPNPDVPAEFITQQPNQYPYTEAPMVEQAPQVDPVVFQPEVQGLIGDYVILNCAVSGNPNPKISWSKDNILIDGTQPRYRLKLDQSLQIITLHKTDSGIYLCTADNGVGQPVMNQINLQVQDSDNRAATVLNDPEDPENVIISLNAPTVLNCFALGYPLPSVTWWKDDNMVPLNSNNFELRKDYSLLIHSVQLPNLGIYTCQAYNGYGKPSSWRVTVRAKGPYSSDDPNDQKYMQYIVNPPEEPVRPEYPYRPEPQQPAYRPDDSFNYVDPNLGGGDTYSIVPVEANITIDNPRFPVGRPLSLPCDVQGYPEPQVQWFKDGVPIYPSERFQVSANNRLTINDANAGDSGTYTCEATNSYSRASSAVAIRVEGMAISPTCTDSRHLANCKLIVQAQFCRHRYYAKFCCRSCTEAGLLPMEDGFDEKRNALENNVV